MTENDKVQLFEDQEVRTARDEENEEWFFSIVNVIGALTDQPDTRHAAKATPRSFGTMDECRQKAGENRTLPQAGYYRKQDTAENGKPAKRERICRIRNTPGRG